MCHFPIDSPDRLASVCECVWSQVSLGLYSLEALKETGYHLDRVTNQRGPATEASISTRSH